MAENVKENLFTLCDTDGAKRMDHNAIVSEDSNAKIIKELRDQVEDLKLELEIGKGKQAPDLRFKWEESENIIRQLSKTWEGKLCEMKEKHKVGTCIY